LAASKRRESSSSGSKEVSIPQVGLNAKFIGKDDDIEKPHDKTTVQIRQGEGVKQMTVKTSIMARLVFGLTPRLQVNLRMDVSK
jgi:hypothetical protein